MVCSYSTAIRFSGTGGVAANGDTTAIEFFHRTAGADQTAGAIGAVTESTTEFSAGLAFATTYGGGLAERVRISKLGNVGIGTASPANKLNIEGSGNALNVSSEASCSYIAAGSTAFTACSSRDIKENIKPFAVGNILQRIANVPVNTYDFINGSKDNLGLMAEDFYPVLERGDGKTIDGQDVQMALWLAVQQLTKENQELKARIALLEAK